MRSVVLGWLAVSLVTVSASSARADGFDAQRFVPAAGAAGGFVVERPIVPKHLGFGAGLFLDYEFSPVVDRDLSSGRVVARPLRHAFAFDFLGSFALFDHFELALHLPVEAVYTGDAEIVGGQSLVASAGVGDLRIVPKVMFWRWGKEALHWELGTMLPVSVPTGNAAALRGSGGVVLDPRVLFAIGGRRWDFTANFGYQWRSHSGPANLAGQGEITYGVGVDYTLPVWHDRIDLNAEIYGGYNHDGAGRAASKSPLELLLGMILRPARDWSLYAGIGPGLTPGLGTPDVRTFVGVRYAHNLIAHGAHHDSDGDGIEDWRDDCPREREDKDGYRDNDGCPDLDNDDDNVPDDEDECPNAPGPRRSGDGNGCPENGYVVVRHGQLYIFGKIQFETGSTQLTRPSERLVDQIADALKRHPQIRLVLIQGHTDDTGAAEYNLKLSRERAAKVKQALVKRGVEERRLRAEGFGQTRPIAPNDTRGGRAKNRRVEFVVPKE